MTKTWVYTGVIFAIALLTAFLMRGVAQSIVQPGDLELVVGSERYDVGEAVNFEVRMAFAKGEVATTTSVRFTVDGPQSFSVELPLKEGAHDLDGLSGLVGSLNADIQMSGVIDISSASSTPVSIISVVLKGVTQGASIDISAQWLPDDSMDSAGDYIAQLVVQLAGSGGVLTSPEIEFSIEAAQVSIHTPTSTATSVNVNDGPTGNGPGPVKKATRTPRPTRTPTATPTATNTAVATPTPRNTITAAEDTPDSNSQADLRTAIVDALAVVDSTRRDAATDANVVPTATEDQPSVTPTRSTTTAARRAVSTGVAVRQSQQALPVKRSTPTPTHTSTATPTTTPLAFVRVSSLSRFSATPVRLAPATTLDRVPSTQTSESGIGLAGMVAFAIAGMAIGAGIIGLLVRFLPLNRP